MIVIQNDGSNPEPTGMHGYILRINQTEICRFKHRREDGLAACLVAAAAAVSAAEYERHARITAMLIGEQT